MFTFKYIKTRDNSDATSNYNLNRNVVNSWANGGWGQMTYFITFEEATDNEIQNSTND